MKALLHCSLLAAIAGCGGEDVDATSLSPLAGYQGWASRTVKGEVAGHGDTIRVIYANDVARSYAHAGRYPVGSVLVKEVHEKGDYDRPGKLLETVVMRKVTEDFLPSTQPLDKGWLFTEVDGAKETRKALCWEKCHRQGKFDYAWFDYADL